MKVFLLAVLAGVVSAISDSVRDLMKDVIQWLRKHWTWTVAGTLVVGIGAIVGFLISRDEQPGVKIDEAGVECPSTVEELPRLVIGLVPGEGAPGTEITVTGSGFAAGKQINIAVLRVVGAGTEPVTVDSVNAYIAGSLGSRKYTVPKVAIRGEHYIVRAEDSETRCFATAQFTVT